MANHTIAPFYQLGRHISFDVLRGNTTEKITGEVMDTDAGWLAVKDDANDEVRWYNLDYIVDILVMERIEHD